MMESRLLKSAALSLLGAWALFLLILVSGQLRWGNRLLWLPPVMFAAAFGLADASWEYEERRAPILIVIVAAIANLILYATGYAFLFLYSIPNR